MLSPVEVPEPPVVPLTGPVEPLVTSLSVLPVLPVLLVSLTAPELPGPLMLACESLIEPALSLVAESETEPALVVGLGPPLGSLADAVLDPLALIASLAEVPPSLPHAATMSGNDNMTT